MRRSRQPAQQDLTATPPPASAPHVALSASVVESVKALLDAAAAVPAPLRSWTIGLDCGHAIAYRQHASLHPPDMLSLPCPTCRTPHTIRTVHPIDPALENAHRSQEARLQLRRAQDEVSRLQRRLARAQLRVERARALLAVDEDAQAISRTAPPRREVDPVGDLPQQGLA